MQAIGTTTVSTPPPSPDVPLPVVVTTVLRQLSGGSQSSLVRCDNGKLYVMKTMSNPQGRQILANETIGAYLMAGIGLPVPPTCHVLLTKMVIEAFPALTICGADLVVRQPEAGLQFASEYLQDFGYELFRDPWKDRPPGWEYPHHILAYLFDVWSYHQDIRQCVYRRNKADNSQQTFYVDNGYLFGGATWKLPLSGPTGSWSPNKDPPERSDRRIEPGIEILRRVLPDLLQNAIRQAPTQWISGNTRHLQEALLIRLSKLSSLVDEDLASFRERKGKRAVEVLRYEIKPDQPGTRAFDLRGIAERLLPRKNIREGGIMDDSSGASR